MNESQESSFLHSSCGAPKVWVMASAHEDFPGCTGPHEGFARYCIRTAQWRNMSAYLDDVPHASGTFEVLDFMEILEIYRAGDHQTCRHLTIVTSSVP